MFKKLLLALALALPLTSNAILISIDYTYDTNGFFDTGTADGAAAKARIENAASFLSSHIDNSWTAIAPGAGINTWTAQFYNPSANTIINRVNDLSIATNTYVVFVGAYSLGSGVLGQGGAGGMSGSGTAPFIENLQTRGQPTGFTSWGGSIAFNNSGTTWHFGETTTGLAGKNDFYSVALHELTHTLGFGTSSEWDNLIVGSTFTGADSEAVYGGAVPLSLDLGHWNYGTDSVVFDTVTAQEAAMTPALTTGTRKLMTTLDMAGLSDLGYNIVPEPNTTILVGLGLILVIAWRKKSHA